MTTTKTPSQIVSELLHARYSVRGFLPEPLPEATLSELFTIAQRAPSWCNIQPWRLALTSPPFTGELSKALVAKAKGALPTPDIDFPLIYPDPYQDHRRKCGGALYGAMGVDRDDKAGRYDAWLRNYELFDAPHLLVVSRDKRLGEYATLDVGVWLGIFLTAAESLGVQACAMASVAAYPELLREHLEIPADEMILFGLALGNADLSVPANQARTTRQAPSANLRRFPKD